MSEHDIKLCFVDRYHCLVQFDNLTTNKTNLNSVRCMSMKIGTNNSTKELLYTHIYWTSVEVIVLARILNQLVLQTVTSNGQMDWQNYPKSRKSIRIKQTQTLESTECPTFPKKKGSLCTTHFDSPRVPKVLKNEEPAHTKRILMPLKPRASAAES